MVQVDPHRPPANHSPARYLGGPQVEVVSLGTGNPWRLVGVLQHRDQNPPQPAAHPQGRDEERQRPPPLGALLRRDPGATCPRSSRSTPPSTSCCRASTPSTSARRASSRSAPTTRTPRSRAEMANNVSEVFIKEKKDNIETKQDSTKTASEWVGKQLDEAAKDLESSETNLYDFKEHSNELAGSNLAGRTGSTSSRRASRRSRARSTRRRTRDRATPSARPSRRRRPRANGAPSSCT